MNYRKRFGKDRNHTNRGRQGPDRMLARRVLAAVTAASIAGQPFAALASTVTRVPGAAGGEIKFENGVADIYAEQMKGEIAVNRFQDFKITAGDIANMYFKTQQGSQWADSLVNFVNSRIDVAGTVNAIRDSKIGGNLFFLSSNGMAVSNTGVINAGSLYVMTPAVDQMALLQGKIAGANWQAKDLVQITNTGRWAEIPLNASGTITVLGTVNATNEVQMSAARIGIGKNVSGETLGDTSADGTVKTASITTGIVDFSNLVNIGTVSAGLREDLKVEQTGSGDIVLSAKAEYANVIDQAFNQLSETLLGVAITEDVPKTIDASVESYGTLKAAGDVRLTAEATNGDKDQAEAAYEEGLTFGEAMSDDVAIAADDAGNFVETIARVDVQGDISAGGDVELRADSDNTFVDNGGALTDKIVQVGTTKLGEALQLDSTNTGFGGNVMILHNSAEVAVGKDADVTAAGTIDVEANALLDGTAGAAANGRKPLVKKKTGTSAGGIVAAAVPSASFGYAKADNNAFVNIEGSLTAKGANPTDENGKPMKAAVNVSAYAEQHISNTATIEATESNTSGKVQGQSLAAAIAVTEGDNNAAVTVNGAITADNGDAAVTADTFNAVVASAAADAADNTVAAAAVNYVEHDSAAAITVNGAISANNVTVDATNYTDENTITADNALGLGKREAQLQNATNINNLLAGLKKNKGNQSSSSTGSGLSKQDFLSKLSEKITAGAAVVITDESNTANVTFGKTANVAADTGDITADANVRIYDSQLFASGTANSFTTGSTSGTDPIVVGAGVVYAGMDNTASVDFEDGDDQGKGQHAVLDAAKNLNVTSAASVEYHRVERMVEAIQTSIDNIETAVKAIENLDGYDATSIPECITELENLLKELKTYKEAYTDEFQKSVSDPSSLTAGGTMDTIFGIASDGLTLYNKVMALQEKVNSIEIIPGMNAFNEAAGNILTNALGTAKNALAFTTPNNYANVAASASAKGGDAGTKLAASGAVTITEFNTSSSVNVGEYASLTAKKDLNIKSENTVDDVNITGKTQFWKSDTQAKGGVGIGASVNYQNFDTYSSVNIDDHAELTGGDISIASDSDIFHVGAILSAGKSDGGSVSGMVTVTDSDSHNDVLIDNGASLKAEKDTESADADAAGGTIDVSAKNDTSANNAILSLAVSSNGSGGGSASVGVGAGVAINNIDVQNTAQIADIDEDGSENTGEISASALDVSAATTGLLNTISIAGGATSVKPAGGGSSDSGASSLLNNLAASNIADGKLGAVSGKLSGVLAQMNLNKNNSAGSAGSSGVPGFSFAGAGSVSLNLVSDTTKAVVDGANLSLNHDGKLQVDASDSAFIGAWSGGAALSFRKAGASGTNVGIAGAVGLNDIDNTVTALVKDSTITGAKDVDVAAVSGGTTVAAGLGLTVSTGGSASSFGGGASASVNLIDKNVNANMENVDLTGDETNGADVDVAAYESDIQVTGGVNANIASKGGNVAGGSATVAVINNNINAGITGGDYRSVKDVNVKGLLASTQVTAAVSAGVAAGGSGGNAFTGAVVYNGISNDINSAIDNGASIVADGTVSVEAKDTSADSDEAKVYQAMLSDYDEHNQLAADSGIDISGASYYTNEDGTVLDDDDVETEAVDYDGQSGSTIVGAAVAAAGGKQNAAGAAVNIAEIDNAFTASISGAKITAGSVQAETDADTLLVGVSAGVAAGSSSFGGMGSVTWQDIDNDLTSQIENSTIHAESAAAKAVNNTLAVNVAGAAAVGKSAGVGAALAYNALGNTIGAYMKGNTISARQNGSVDVTAEADNTGKTYGIGAGVAAAQNVAVNGTVAVNRGGSNTEAVIDKSNDNGSVISDAGAVSAAAKDDTYRLAVVGSVSGSGTAAIGGGVAYNDVGGSSAGSENSSQNTLAAIRNTDISMAANGEHSVKAAVNDAARLLTVAVGVAASKTAAVQGSAASSLINKNASALIENTDIDKNGGTAANVTVDAENASEITSSADTASVAAQGAGVGAGVAVNRIVQQTNAAVNGGTMNVRDLTVQAKGNPRIENVGVGIAAAGQGVGAAGSVSVNMIQNDVRAHLGGGAHITADGTVGVVAESNEQIANYSGLLSAAGQGAGVGISVSVNQIRGETTATVGDAGTDTKVSAQGLGGGLTTDTEIADGEINDTLIDSDTIDMEEKIDRTSETRWGLVVDASSTRDMKSFLVNVGVAGQGAGTAPTVNVNMIDGATRAGIAHTAVNNENTAGNVYVNAGDYTNMSGFVGSAGVGGMGAGVGLGSDTNTVDRAVEAAVADSTVRADALEVDADSRQGVSSFVVGAGVAGIGGGVAGVVTVTELANTTAARLLNSTINADTVSVASHHTGIVNAGNVGVGAAGVGAGVGLSVGVLKDNSTTETVVGSEDGETKIEASGDVTISADNTTTVKPSISATGAGAAGVAGATSVNNLNSAVKIGVNKASISSKKGIAASAHNTFNVDAYMGAQAGGIAGVGAGVTINTIDSTIQTNVTGSTLEAAGNVALTADETRNITQLATNVAAGGAAAGANVAVTTVGEAVEDTEDSNAESKIDEANAVYGDDASSLLNGAEDALATADIIADEVTPTVNAGYGGGKDSQITVNITNSKVTAGDTLTASAKEQDNISMTLGSGAAGAAAVNAGVGILNVNRNVGVNVSGGSMDAETIKLGTDITGTADLEVYQGSAGVVGANAAVGMVNTTGSSKVDIDGAKLTGQTISVSAADHGSVTANTLGITVGAVSVGAIVSGAENTSSTEVEMTGTTVSGTGEDTSFTVGTDKANTVEAHATGGTGGVLAGSGVVATASDSGASSITLGAAKNTAAANRIVMDAVNIDAAAQPAVKAIADSVSVGFWGTAGASVATASAEGAVNVNVHDGNTLDAETVDITGSAGAQEGKNTAEASVEGNSGGGYASIADNAARADVDMSVNVHVGDVAYRTETEQTLVGYEDVGDGSNGDRKPVYEEVTRGATALTVNGMNTAKAAADARGVNIGGIFSSGNNQAFTTNTSETRVALAGGSGETLLESLTVTAAGTGDNTAMADGSGGGFISGDLAAYVNNEMAAQTAVTVGGAFQVEGDVRVEALQSDTANINADALKAAVVGASATMAENSITGTTSVTLDDADITGGGTLDVSAANTVTFGDRENYAVEGSGYGGIAAQGADFDNTIEKTASIDMKNGSTVTTAGAQTYEAKTTGNIQAGGYIKAAGLGAFTWVDVDNAVTANDRISVDGSSALMTTEAGADLVLAAVDNMDMAVDGVADTQGGAAGGASSDVASTLKRNNSLKIDGTLYGMNDVNLYAGKDKNGSESRLDLSADSEAYNKTALAVSVPLLNDQIYQNNQVILGGDSRISSVRHINAYADAGKETIRDSSVLYTWYWSDKNENYTSSTIGDEAPDNKHSSNFVQADGTLTAGTQNKQYITIGGTYDPETGKTDGSQLVFFDDAVKDAVNAYGNGQTAVGKDGLTVSVSDGVDKDAIQTGSFDYGTALFERYNELGDLMQAYAEDPYSTAYLGYKAERGRILDQMISMHLVEELTAENGTTYWQPIDGVKIDYIELPDIVASGGNINIQSDALTGGGSLTAKGAPEVVINNNTNLYLKVNNVTVGEAGGEIHFNDAALTADGTKPANMSFSGGITPDASEKNQGRIIINGNYGGQAVFANVTVDGTTQTIQTTPRADIEINGLVNSEDGTVEISSAANNIIVQGETASDSAGVKGQTVKLSASKGSVSQGFQEGIVSIGGNVQDQYQSDYESLKNQLYTEHEEEITGTDPEDVHDVAYGENGEKASGNMIAGENIYISASDINVNGAIQSGYGDYEVIIPNDEATLDAIAQKRENWEASGGGLLSDAMVTTGDTYRVVKGADILGDDGVYHRQLDVYYNPSTGQLVVPDVDARGGQVYLTGRISSTGSGSIKVLDGAYNITVNNETGTDLQLGKLVSSDVSGLISIADTGTKRLTEFTRGGTVVKDLTRLDASTGDYAVLSQDGASDTYAPEEGLRYNWTTGQQVTTERTFTNTQKAGLWGAVETMNQDALTKFEENHTDVPALESSSEKPNGEYIGAVGGIENDKDFAVIFDNTVLDKNRVGPGEPERWSTGFLGWFKWERYTWTVSTGTTQQYVASVKADKPISIGFFGNSDGNSQISIHAAGNINLTNNIGSANAGTGSLIALTAGGAIYQQSGSLVGDNIALSAGNGIDGINITSIGDTVHLNAVNSGSGDVSIDVNAAYGKAGDVVLDKLHAGSLNGRTGDVSLTADGSITQSGAGESVIGSRIDLVSENGTIGTENQALVLHGGQSVTDGTDSLSASVNAQAEGDIFLTQAEGDMRIGRVYSETGGVTVTVSNGDLIDALPAGESIDRGDTEALIQKWKDLGLIAGGGDYTEQQAQDVADYEASVKEGFESYQKLKDYYGESGLPAEYTEAYEAYTAAKQQYDTLRKDYDAAHDRGAGETLEMYNQAAESYIRNQMGETAYNAYRNPSVSGAETGDSTELKTVFAGYAAYEQLAETYGGYDSAEAYLAGADAQKHIMDKLKAAGAEWDQNQLLYAISDAVINPSSTSTENVVKDPNLKGKDITLNVSGSVGLNSDHTTTIQFSDLNNVENLKALANADAGSVIWDEANGQAVINEKTPLGVQLTAGGSLHVTAEGNVYLAGRTEEAQDVENALRIDRITGGNIRLQGHDGIFDSGSASAAITGHTLLLQGGDGGLGTADNAMTIAVSGPVQATAGEGIYLDQTGESDFQIYSMSAGGDIVLTAAGNIVSTDTPVSSDEDETAGGETGETALAEGYIRSDDGTISLTSQGGIGTDGEGLRVLGNGAAVNAAAKGEIYLAGVNGTSQDGTLVLGKISGKSLSVTGEGRVSLGRADDESTEGSEAVDGSITTTDRDASITGTSVDLADGRVNTGTHGFNVTASAGSITQSVNAEGITADHVNLSSTGSQQLLSGNNQINTVTIKGLTDGSLTGGVEIHNGAKDFDVYFGADKEGLTVHDGGIRIEHTGSGTLTAYGSAVTEAADETVNADIAFNSQTGGITVTGDMTAGDAFSAVTTSGAVKVDGNVKAENNVTASTGSGAIEFTGTVSSTAGNISATTNSGDVSLGAADGRGTIHADKGSIMVHTDSGAVTLNGSADAGTDISLTSMDGGNIAVHGTAAAGQNVSATTEKGSITFGGDVTATAGNITADTKEGTITVNGSTQAGIDIGLTSGSGAITTTGSLTAGQHVSAETGSGAIQLGGRVTAEAGNITADSGDGSITFSDTATAGQHVSAETENGDIAFNGAAIANAGNVTASVTGEGDVTFGGAVTAQGMAEETGTVLATVSRGNITAADGAVLTADRDVHFETQDGDIAFHAAVNAGNDLFAQTAGSGSILVHDNLAAKQDITLNTNRGDIRFEGKDDNASEDIHVTSDEGNVLLKVNNGGQGDILDTNREENGDHAVIHAELGDVTVENGGIEAGGDASDVDLYEVYAKENSKISTAEGDLHLVNVSGSLVAVVVRKPGKQMETEHVEAATEIQIAGSNMSLDDIVQREDGNGFLTITPDGANKNEAIDDLTIGDIRTNGGVRFDRLWLHTGDIHVSQGALHLDKVYVEDKATFSTGHMATDVFGSAPVYDDTKDSAFWVNTDINRPEEALDAWQADGTAGGWMYIHFAADAPVQQSNGNLLYLKDRHDVYSQRYSMADWMNLFTDRNFYRFYERYYAPELSYHDRYGLIDGTGADADNAESSEIIIE